MQQYQGLQLNPFEKLNFYIVECTRIRGFHAVNINFFLNSINLIVFLMDGVCVLVRYVMGFVLLLILTSGFEDNF
jgi:hypothetical protein